MDFESMTVLIRNFMLLGYGDIFNQRKYDMIGTTQNSNVLIIHSYSLETNKYEEVFKYDFNLPIFSCTPGNFTGKGNTSLIVTFVNGDTYKNKFLEFTINNKKEISYKITNLLDSSYPPMAITDYETAKPAIVIGNEENELIMLRYNNDTLKFTAKTIISLTEEFYKNHPYAFVDLDGDLKAEMVIFTFNKNRVFLNFYKYESDEYRKKFSFQLPEGELGSILFGDFTHKGLNSMVFISKENDNNFYINLFVNSLNRYEPKYYKKNYNSVDVENNSVKIFKNSNDLFFKTSFRDCCPNHTPVFELNLNEFKKISGGIFSTDIDLDGYHEIFVTAQNDKGHSVIVPLKLSDDLSRFELLNNTDFFKIENAFSFSTVDYNNKGKESIVINRHKDGDIVVEGYYNLLNEKNMKLSLTTILNSNKNISYGMCLPGTSYLLLANHGQYLFYSSNFGPGPFLNLVSQTAMVGLGYSIYTIDCLKFGIPSVANDYKGIYLISANIIQNLDLIISVGKNGNYKVEAFFEIVSYAIKIAYVVLIAGAANIIVSGIITYNYNKKLKLARTKDSMHPLFRSL